MNKISVIIPAYNAEKYIKETIESVLSQTYRNFELIIIDDGSTDSTANIIKDFASKDERIQYIYQKNASQAVARNRGIKVSKGRFIAFLDADDLWMPDKLEKQILLLGNKNIGLIYTDVIKIDHNSKLIPSKSSRKFLKGNVYKNIIYDNFIATSTVLVRKDALTENKLFFRTERQGVEDWDLWIRLAEITEFDYLSDPLVQYRVYGGNESSNYLKMSTSRMTTLDDLVKEINNKSKWNDKEKRQLFSLIKKGRSLQLLRTGHELIGNHQNNEARQFFWQAIKLNPFSIRNYWGLVKYYIS